MSDLCSIFSATVKDTADPLKRGRVRLQIPQALGKNLSTWAEPTLPTSYPPGRDTTVSVWFIDGDVAQPVYSSVGTISLQHLSTSLQSFVNTSVPTGTVKDFAGPLTAIPAGWFVCNGTEVPKATYARLYAQIGDSYGTAVDSSNFKLPFMNGSDEGWKDLTFANNWVQYGAPFERGSYRMRDGEVRLRGLVRNGTVNATVANLPIGYRPAASEVFLCVADNRTTGADSTGTAHTHNMANSFTRVDVATDGSVSVSGHVGTLGWVSLGGIRFVSTAWTDTPIKKIIRA